MQKQDYGSCVHTAEVVAYARDTGALEGSHRHRTSSAVSWPLRLNPSKGSVYSLPRLRAYTVLAHRPL
jgi:hypothetical protein